MTAKKMPQAQSDTAPPKRAHWLAEFAFKPGKDWKGNAGGRPKKKPVTERYARDMEMRAPDHVCEKLGLARGSTLGDCAARSTLLRAIVGKDVNHQKEITDRLEGKATQSLNVNLSTTDVLAERLRAARKNRDRKK